MEKGFKDLKKKSLACNYKHVQLVYDPSFMRLNILNLKE